VAEVTFDERIQAIQAFGCSARQARFLALVALHGGYCVRRQYLTSTGTRNGKNAQRFLDQLVVRQVAARCRYRADRGYVYRLQHRALYRALGLDQNRNRRPAAPALIARKLMLLDVVLSEPNADWIATESEKVALFTTRFGVAANDLPRATLIAEGADPHTTRRFQDKLPIAVVGQPPVAHFVYLTVDGSVSGFERFLHTHGRLLGALPTWVVVVAHLPQVGPTAIEEAFRRFAGDDPVVAATRIGDLERYFVARRAVERNEFTQLSIAELQTFRSTRLAFAEPRIEVLFARWIASGTPHLDRAFITQPVPPGRLIVRPLEHTYQQFGAFAGVI
jgi:hypothetical protein